MSGTKTKYVKSSIYILFSISFLPVIKITAQNVGIGLTNPQQALSVKGGMNIDQTNLNNGNIGNNVLRFGDNSGEAIGSARTAFSSNQYGLDFYTASIKRMVISNSGDVGIGTNTPGFPLNFPNSYGDKISLWGDAGFHYGFGIQGNLLQIYTDDVASDIAFGHGRSDVFFEKLRIKGNGALSINGNTGNAGQVLQSNGDSSPSWKTMGSIIETHYRYPSQFSAYEGTLGLGATLVFTSLTFNITVTKKSRLIISASLWGYNGGCFGCGYRAAAINIRINGINLVSNINGLAQLVTPNDASDNVVISNLFYDVLPGACTIEFIAQHSYGGDIYLYSKYATIAVLPID